MTAAHEQINILLNKVLVKIFKLKIIEISVWLNRLHKQQICRSTNLHISRLNLLYFLWQLNVNTGADLSKWKFNLLFITFTNMDATHSSKEKSNLLSSEELLPRNAAAEKEVKRIWAEKVLWARSFTMWTLHNLQLVNYPEYYNI